MAAPQTPPEPPSSVSVIELRKRLQSSTPPSRSEKSIVAKGLEPEPSSGSGSVATEQLLSKLRMPAYVASPSVSNRTPLGISAVLNGSFLSEAPVGESPVQELNRLRMENKELRQLLGEMKVLLQEASDNEQEFSRQLVVLEADAAEKQAQIDQYTTQLQQIEEQISSGELAPAQPAGPPKTKTELEEWADELEKENSTLHQQRRQIDQERKQLREDEESLEKQMREMEVSMARERAMMARQETELKRLSAEIQHELELMQRGDASLREQMQKFQRRAADVLAGPRPGPGGSSITGHPQRK